VAVERLVETLARVESIDEMPRLPWPTLRRGAQILIDSSEGMDPFAQDQDDLAGRLRRTVGEDRVELLRFSGCPTRGAGAGPRHTWHAYEPPSAGKPVILLTDLGVAMVPLATDRADAGEWRAFAALIRAAGCPLAAFVPYPSTRIPMALRRALPVIPWDRRTSIGAVRTLVGPVLEAAG
jgi:hypothetical protein